MSSVKIKRKIVTFICICFIGIWSIGDAQMLGISTLYTNLKESLKVVDTKEIKLSKELQYDTSYKKDVFNKMTELEISRAVIEDKFIQDNPADLVSYHLVRKHLTNRNDLDRINEGLDVLDKSLKDNAEVKAYLAILQETEKLEIGNIAPNFTAKSIAGKSVSLSDFRGKYLLLDFWASWCGPCRVENSHVVKAYQAFKDKNFTIIGISLDNDKDAWLESINDDGLTWTNVSDLQLWESPIAKKYFINTVPQNFLIDPSGKIVAKNLRGEGLFEKLQELLGGTSVELRDPKAASRASIATSDLIRKRDNATDMIKDYQTFLKNYPPTLYKSMNYIYGIPRLALIPLLFKLDYRAAEDSLQSFDHELLKRPLYASVVHILTDKGRIELAEQLITTEISRLDALRDSNEVANDSYYDQLYTYSHFLKRTNRPDLALEKVEEIRRVSRYSDQKLSFYGLLLSRNKKHKEALVILEKLTKTGSINEEEKEAFKTSWIAVNKSEQAFDTYYESLTKDMVTYVSKDILSKKKVYQAPSFELCDLDGKVVSLASLKGKVVFLDFWATWCGPCIGSFPAMKRASEFYKNREDVVFLFINTSERTFDYESRKTEVGEFLKKGKYDLYVLLDENENKTFKVRDNYKVESIPAKFIIDKNGLVQYAFTGFRQGTDDAAVEEIKQMIESLL